MNLTASIAGTAMALIASSISAQSVTLETLPCEKLQGIAERAFDGRQSGDSVEAVLWSVNPAVPGSLYDDLITRVVVDAFREPIEKDQERRERLRTTFAADVFWVCEDIVAAARE